MSIRYRWFEIGVQNNFKELINMLEEHAFSENTLKGFKAVDISSKKAEFQYIWTTTVYSTKMNSDGENEVNAIDSIEMLNIFFISANNKVFLKVENPTKSLKSLMTSLESLISYGFYQKPILFDYGAPEKIFYNFDRIITTKLVISGLSVSKDTIAKMELISAKGIHIDKISTLKNQKYGIDLVAYDVMYKHVMSSITFSKTGLVRIKGDLTLKILDTLEARLFGE